MKIVLCNWFQIWRWWLIPNTDECHVLPCQFIINNDTGFRHYNFNITQSVLTNNYIIYLFLAIDIDIIPLPLFCWIRSHVFIIDKKHNLQVEIIHINYFFHYHICYTNTMKVLNFELTWLRALVHEYVSPAVDSELFILNKFVRKPVGLFVIVYF